jgi:hypothetical protein
MQSSSPKTIDAPAKAEPPEPKAPLDPRVARLCREAKLPESDEFAALVEFRDPFTHAVRHRAEVDWPAVRAAWLDPERRASVHQAMHYHLKRVGTIVLDGAHYGTRPLRETEPGYIWPEESIGSPPVFKSTLIPAPLRATPGHRTLKAD